MRAPAPAHEWLRGRHDGIRSPVPSMSAVMAEKGFCRQPATYRIDCRFEGAHTCCVRKHKSARAHARVRVLLACEFQLLSGFRQLRACMHACMHACTVQPSALRVLLLVLLFVIVLVLSLACMHAWKSPKRAHAASTDTITSLCVIVLVLSLVQIITIICTINLLQMIVPVLYYYLYY